MVRVWFLLMALASLGWAQGGAGGGTSTKANPNDYRPTNTPGRPKCPSVRTFVDTQGRLASIDCNGSITLIGSLNPGAAGTFIYAKDFGAVCNNVANDTAAINAAQAAARTQKKTLVLPAGICRISQFVVEDNEKVIGAGMNFTTLKGIANQPIVRVATKAFNAHLNDFAIEGDTTMTSQVGLEVEGNEQYWGFTVHNLYIRNTGSHGLYLGANPFSIDFNNIHIDRPVGYPVLVDSPIAPGLTLRNIYVHALNTASLKIGYRIKRGRVTCENCNGIDNVPSLQGSRWAVVGKRAYTGGADTYPDTSDTTAGGAFVNWINSNFEAYEAVGVDHYYFSSSTFDGEIRFAYVNSTAGNNPNRIGLRYEIDETLGLAFSPYLPRGKMTGTAVIGQPETDYKNGRFIHSNNIPPLELEGVGGAVAPPSIPLGLYYDTANAKSEPLFRSDARAVRTTVTTGTTSFNRPSYRYFEVNCTASPCNLQIPWPGWYRRQETVTITDIAGTAGTIPIVITTQAQARINGENNLDIRRNRGTVILMPYESDTVNGVEWRIVNEYAGGVPATVPISGDSNVDFFPRWSTSRGQLSLSSALFQFGDDLVTPGKILLQRAGGNFVNLDATPGSTYTWRFPTGLPGGVECLKWDNTGQVFSGACASGGGGGGSGTVTSVGLSMPNIFAVANTPVTSSGAFGVTLTSQAANRVWASPNGASGVPSFRSLVTADIPTLPGSKINITGTPTGAKFLRDDFSWQTVAGGGGGGGSVTSVGLGLPADFTVSGSPVTGAGTLTAAWANQTANKVLAAPSGASGAPTFRTLVVADIPTLPASKITFDGLQTPRTITQTAHGLGSAGTFVAVYKDQTTPNAWYKADGSDAAKYATAVVKIVDANTLLEFTVPGVYEQPSHGFPLTAILVLGDTPGTIVAASTGDTRGKIGEAYDINKLRLYPLPVPPVSGAGGGGSVASVFGRTGTIVAAANDYTWAQVDKTVSSLADITTRSAADLSSGTLPLARLSGITTSQLSASAGITNAQLANSAVTLNGNVVNLGGALGLDTLLGLSANGIVKRTAANTLATAVSGTDYEAPLTFSTGLTRSTNTVTVNTTQNIVNLSNLTGNGLVTTSGGAGALSVTVPGTGVLTALGVNVGSASAFVTNGGALGTPASGVATNLTGLPPTTGIVGWPANASGALTNNGGGVLSWAAGGGGGSPGGSSGQVQVNIGGAFGGAAGFEYQSGASPNVSITAQSSTYVPLVVKGAASQAGNLQQWQNNGGSPLSRVESSGAFLSNGAAASAHVAFRGRIDDLYNYVVLQRSAGSYRGTITLGQGSNGGIINTEAGGSIDIVPGTTSAVNVQGNLLIDSAAFVNSTKSGFKMAPATRTFESTGSVGTWGLSEFGITSIAGQSTWTVTDLATVRIVGAPTAGTNVTATNKYGLLVAAGAAGSVAMRVDSAASPTVDVIQATINGTRSVAVTKDGDVFVADNTRGFILKSPDGTCYRFTVANGGSLNAGASVTCP
jgi:hypothetical protein